MSHSGIFVSEGDVMAFRRTIIAWGREHFRPFPWRFTADPYRILMAEVMLHRTRAAQVVPVYSKFVGSYPDVPALARATGEELYKTLYPLGLRWRVALIYEMATHLAGRFNGSVPVEKEALLSLPGISDYIASAVRCFAWGYPDFLADTNTVRVVGRMFGLKIRDSSRRNSRFRNILAALVDMEYPRLYNYALLDVADRICVKKRPPECNVCPVAKWCIQAGGIPIHGKGICED
jgi:A/G-specific adenine glycosylase